jgi:hypothetical protein
MIRRASIPRSEWTTGSRCEREKDLIAHCAGREKRRTGETGDLRLWSWLNCRGRSGEVHLRKACGACSRRSAFATESDKNGLQAGCSNASRAGIGKTRHATNKDRAVRAFHRIEEANILHTRRRAAAFPAPGYSRVVVPRHDSKNLLRETQKPNTTGIHALSTRTLRVSRLDDSYQRGTYKSDKQRHWKITCGKTRERPGPAGALS